MSADQPLAPEALTARQPGTIEELSGEIARQWKAIRALERRLEALGEQLAAGEDGAPAADRKPPHW